mgnify:CR=1 FL=1
MRLAVLASPNSWYWNDLRRAAGGRHDLHCVSFDRIRARLEPDGLSCVDCGAIRLNDFDVVLVRTMPPGSLEQVVFRMDALARLAASGVIVMNPPRTVEVAVDKYLASAKLQAAGLPTPRTVVCQTADDALAAFDALGGDVVVKPLFGSEGRGIMRIDDRALADRAFRAVDGRIRSLLDACPDRRQLVHSDLLHYNVLVTPGANETCAVFSWKCSTWGDSIYDLAWCTFWGRWHPGIGVLDLWERVVPTLPHTDAVDVGVRHHVYELQIGASHLGWYATLGDDTNLAWTLRQLDELLEGGPQR